MTEHRNPMSGTFVPFMSTCDAHGKRTYGSRKYAKAAIRLLHNGENMHSYRCDALAGLWHIGHLPKSVVRGKITRSEIYGGPS